MQTRRKHMTKFKFDGYEADKNKNVNKQGGYGGSTGQATQKDKNKQNIPGQQNPFQTPPKQQDKDRR